MLRGRDIKRYSYEWADLWLINTHNGYTAKNKEKIQPIDIEEYPALKAHLDQHYPALAKRGDKGITPYNLRNCAYLEEFEKEKIVYPNMNKEFMAMLDAEHFMANQKCFILTKSNSEENILKYLKAILNSKTNFWYFKQIGATLGASGYEMSKIFVEKLPIPKIDSNNEEIADQIIALVEEILALKESDSKQDTTNLESQIDKLVYSLYNLTDEEIITIQGKSNETNRISNFKFQIN